ncbi:MAG: hypothetical protein CL693_04770 [Cellvibrionaceae bacterium]|nr:hypothetical protein [Cellvibrionaceae bacterium]
MKSNVLENLRLRATLETVRCWRALWLVSLLITLPACQESETSSNKVGEVGLIYTIEKNPMVLGVDTIDGRAQLLLSADSDLNGDGLMDHIALLQLNSSGSGIFYYLNVFVRDQTSALTFVVEAFLGDRLHIDGLDIYGPQSVSSITGVAIPAADHGQLFIAYRQHNADQAMSEKPKLFMTKHYKLVGEELVLLEQN